MEAGQFLVNKIEEFISSTRQAPSTPYVEILLEGTGGTKSARHDTEYLQWEITPTLTSIKLRVDMEYFKLDEKEKKNYLTDMINEYFEEEASELEKKIDLGSLKKAKARKDIADFLKASVIAKKQGAKLSEGKSKTSN